MKNYFKIFFFSILVSFLPVEFYAQNITATSESQRTPEQEATKQTEKLQYELNLNAEQVKAVYQINLKYAQTRQNIANRKVVMQTIKNKEEEIHKVLNSEQKEQLQSKRVPRQQVEIGNGVQYLRTSPQMRSGFQPSENRNVRSNFRTSESTRQSSTTKESGRNTSTTRTSEDRTSTTRTGGSNTSRSSSSTYSTPTRSSSGDNSRSSSGNSSERNTGGRR